MWRVNAGTGSARLPEEDVQEAEWNNPHMAPLMCVSGSEAGLRGRTGHKRRVWSRNTLSPQRRRDDGECARDSNPGHLVMLKPPKFPSLPVFLVFFWKGYTGAHILL